MLEELVLFKRGHADPWHRVSCCEKPVLLFIEFCQVVGPRPLYHYPKNVGPHLDLDQVALWVMSSEHIPASLTCTYNQQLGLYALIQYATILDLSARAFQRPFAIVLLTNNKPNTPLIELFHNKCIDYIRPFLACNRQHFQYLMQQLINVADSTQSENFNNYYAVLSASTPLPPKLNLWRGLQIVAHRAKIWYNRILEGKNCYMNPSGKCECGVDPTEFEKFLPFIVEHCASSELFPLFELAPCAGREIFNGFENLYNVLVADETPKGVLFSCGVPVLRSFFGANTSFNVGSSVNHEGMPEENVTSNLLIAERDSLKTFSLNFVNVFYHLLAGECIAVLASTSKESLGINILQKLNFLKFCKRFESAPWFTNLERPPSNESRLVGFLCTSVDSAKWSDPNFSILIDLNYQRMKCREYSGKFLNSLIDINMRNFPTDKSAMALFVSIITNIQQFTILAKYTSPRFVADQLKLSIPDQMILFNSLMELNLTKFCYLASDIKELPKRIPLKRMRL